MVIKLEDWNKDKEYDRLGLEEEYTEYLGNKVVCHSLPIRPIPLNSMKYLVTPGAEPTNVSSLTFLISTASSVTRRWPLFISSSAASL